MNNNKRTNWVRYLIGVLLTILLILVWQTLGCEFSIKIDQSNPSPTPSITPQNAPGSTTPSPAPLPPGKIVGITLDSVEPLKPIVEALKALPKKPWVRIVFDEGESAADYLPAVKAIAPYATILGMVVDSMAVPEYSVQEYEARYVEYMKVLGDLVTVWEIGNELNGEWLEEKAADKAIRAYKVVKLAGKRTALTTYYNKGCFDDKQNEMFTWVERNIPDGMRMGLDYLLVSYYEDDCNGAKPDWQAVFDRLHGMFPGSRLGIGECGTTRTAAKAAYFTRYYGMSVTTPGFIGGFFYWYGRQDMIPMTKPMWNQLKAAL